MKRKGICFVCACTQEDGCPEGCSWANLKQTLCTSCEPLSAIERMQKRDRALDDLANRLDLLDSLREKLLVRRQVAADEPARVRTGGRKRGKKKPMTLDKVKELAELFTNAARIARG